MNISENNFGMEIGISKNGYYDNDGKLFHWVEQDFHSFETNSENDFIVHGSMPPPQYQFIVHVLF